MKAALKKNAKATAKAVNSAISGMINSASKRRSTPDIIIKIIITTKFSSRLMNAAIHPDSTITYFGKFIFLIKSPRANIEVMLPVVTSVK